MRLMLSFAGAPFWEATAKYTVVRAVRKSTKTKSGKRNKYDGRR